MLDMKKMAVNQVWKANDGRQTVKILGFSRRPEGATLAEPDGMTYAHVCVLGEGLPGGLLKTLFLELPRFGSAGRSGYKLAD